MIIYDGIILVISKNGGGSSISSGDRTFFPIAVLLLCLGNDTILHIAWCMKV